MKLTKFFLFACLLLISSNSHATMVAGWTEGLRDQVAGTSLVPTVDVPTATPFDLGTLTNAGDYITLHGRIVGAVDPYTFTSNVSAFKIEFIFAGVDLEGGGILAPSGFIAETKLPKEAKFSTGPATSTSITTDVDSGNPLIFASTEMGTIDFVIDGLGQKVPALYDIKITGVQPVPVPAAVWLFGSVLATLGLFRRRAK
jgi:hypothetical protein